MDAQRFLELAGDDELLQFLRRLPMVAGNDDGPVTLPDLIYEMKLWPFVVEAWKRVDGEPGFPGRILQMSKVYKRAEAELEELTGEKRRLPRVIDLTVFLDIYSNEGLP
ncbi:hypothetical protein [Phaeobacter sp. Ax4a-4a]|uniref:hypothetical protein n=1 Tax=Phaeobacter sp. Ax4a-4a TaxID=3112437 RepID=UPI003A8BE185